MQYLTNVKNLTTREQKLWNLIRTKSGVVMAYGIPGISKSATFKSIAAKMGFEYFDLRTTTMDETDLGVFPTIRSESNYKVVDHAIPSWAAEANKKPCLIHFEELNRCSSNIRNAVLGILLERIIGTSFTFNDHVYMVASGNPVTDHDSDVEGFGFALRNRLIPVEFELTLTQWINEFANDKIIPQVIDFLKLKPDYFGNSIAQLNKFIDTDSQTQYPSPRSWTFLSNYVKAFDEPNEKVFALKDRKTLQSFVGELAATAFVNYINETFKVNVKDVLKGTAKLESLDTMTVQRITQEFTEGYKLHDLNPKELTNWKNFIKIMSDEIRAGHFSSLASSCIGVTKEQKNVYKDIIGDYKNLAKLLVKTIK